MILQQQERFIPHNFYMRVAINTVTSLITFFLDVKHKAQSQERTDGECSGIKRARKDPLHTLGMCSVAILRVHQCFVV